MCDLSCFLHVHFCSFLFPPTCGGNLHVISTLRPCFATSGKKVIPRYRAHLWAYLSAHLPKTRKPDSFYAHGFSMLFPTVGGAEFCPPLQIRQKAARNAGYVPLLCRLPIPPPATCLATPVPPNCSGTFFETKPPHLFHLSNLPQIPLAQRMKKPGE